MFRSNNDTLIEDVETLKTDVADIKRRQDDQEKHGLECNAKHEQHNLYRRSNDSKIEGVHETLKEMLGVIKDHLPTIKRSRENYAALDTIIRWGGSASILIAAYLAVKHLFGQ